MIITIVKFSTSHSPKMFNGVRIRLFKLNMSIFLHLNTFSCIHVSVCQDRDCAIKETLTAIL